MSLLVGLIIGLRSKRRGLLWFLAPLLLIHLYVGLAGYFRGALALETIGYVNTAFVLAEVAALIFLIIRLKGARLAAVLLSVFCVTYALPATFLANMSFTDTWL